MKEGSYKKIKEEGCCLTYDVNIADEDFSMIQGVAVERVRAEVEYPGFRKGKVPLDIINKHFSDAIRSEIRDIAVRNLLDLLFEKENIFPVVSPSVYDISIDPEKKSISFKIYIEQNPKFDPKEYTDFEVKRTLKKITDADIDNHINSIREYNAYLKPVENEPVSKKHYIIADYEVYENGNKANEFKNQLIDMSSPDNIMGLDNVVIGANKGDIKEFENEFDGKKMRVVIKINDIKEKVVPELDDNFIKQLGAKDIADLREQVKKILEAEENERSEKELIENIENHLISKNEFPLPPTLVRQEMEELFEVIKKRANIPDTENVQLKDYEDKVKPVAERNLKITYILHQIAKKENIKSTEDDLYGELDKVVKSLKNEDEIKRARELFEQRKDYIMASMTENKTIDFIKSKIKIVAGDK
ncbi:MAG: trigger factor [Elusimicrobiales bacterium]|nr:trigger factor [Elusimicrobiales bacterium]